MWELVLKLGLYALDFFISDMVKRAQMKKAFQEFVANRNSRAAATVELYESVQEQTAELNEKQKQLEKEAAKGGQ